METTAVMPFLTSAPVKLASLSFKIFEFSCIIVDDIGKYGFKAGQVSAALGVVYVVTEAQDHFLMELIDILEGYFYGTRPSAFSGKVKNVRDSLL